MALSPYKKAESPLNRSRSSSCSSPVRNRILYQEIYSVGANTLVRSYSCDQVFDKDASGRTFQTTQIQVSSFITPEKNIHVTPIESQPKKPRRLALEYRVDKPEISNGKAMSVKEQSVVRTAWKKTMLFSLLTATTACAIYFYINFRECSYVWNLEKTESELKHHVFGQNQAVAKINSVLKACNSTNDAHIMVFTGGVGTGKTYSSSIISRNFPWSSKKFIAYSEFFTSDVENLLKQKLVSCGCNLIIVDDLSVKTVGEAINFIALLNNKRKKNENLLVILIFQAHDEADRSGIISKFKNTYLNIYHVPFKPLTRDAVERCFRTEIQREQVNISEDELKKLIEEKMKHIDIEKGTSGCKGITEEVASFYMKNIV